MMLLIRRVLFSCSFFCWIDDSRGVCLGGLWVWKRVCSLVCLLVASENAALGAGEEGCCVLPLLAQLLLGNWDSSDSID